MRDFATPGEEIEIVKQEFDGVKDRELFNPRNAYAKVCKTCKAICTQTDYTKCSVYLTRN